MKIRYWTRRYFDIVIRYVRHSQNCHYYRKFTEHFGSLYVTYRCLRIRGLYIFFDVGLYRSERSQYGFRSLLTDKERRDLEKWSEDTSNAFCVYCGNKMGKDDDNLVNGIYCPICKQGFPLVVEKIV